MASSATLINRFLLTRTSSNPILPSSIRSLSSTLYWIVKPVPQRARDDALDDLHRSGLLIQDEDDALYLQKSMPGLGKDDVDVEISPKRNTLIITGDPGGYKALLHLPPSCQAEEAVSKMENGLLRVLVPKTKPNGAGPTQEAQWGPPGHYKPGDAILMVGYLRQDE
ncbi:heat shock 22 kDa protein, mitochondrial-like [Rosa rugosa]|uniref:heat shock 22 kDa protein, mitochondrial-like n=1 Tax=Rosa rugosa TaxID=74645 RepID=UPI002B407B22|nr:heat shock 22 kDa protein, mitochondrial-like [Rosa rugosa]